MFISKHTHQALGREAFIRHANKGIITLVGRFIGLGSSGRSGSLPGHGNVTPTDELQFRPLWASVAGPLLLGWQMERI